jgi:hypothetical protein
LDLRLNRGAQDVPVVKAKNRRGSKEALGSGLPLARRAGLIPRSSCENSGRLLLLPAAPFFSLSRPRSNLARFHPLRVFCALSTVTSVSDGSFIQLAKSLEKLSGRLARYGGRLLPDGDYAIATGNLRIATRRARIHRIAGSALPRWVDTRDSKPQCL